MGRVVLVVDDDPLVLEVTSSMLEELGCDVIVATSASEALEHLANNQQVWTATAAKPKAITATVIRRSRF
jgi:CheY-like chemotaxis protein